MTRQSFRLLAISIAPRNSHPEGGRGPRIPSVRGHEDDLFACDSEVVDGELIDLGMRFVNADCFDGEYRVKEVFEAPI